MKHLTKVAGALHNLHGTSKLDGDNKNRTVHNAPQADEKGKKVFQYYHSSTGEIYQYPRKKFLECDILAVVYISATGEKNVQRLEGELKNYYVDSFLAEGSNERSNTRPENRVFSDEFEYEDRNYFDAGVDIENEFNDNEFIHETLSTLKEQHREIFRKCVFEGKSYVHVAKALGKDESTVRKAVQRALKKIEKNLK